MILGALIGSGSRNSVENARGKISGLVNLDRLRSPFPDDLFDGGVGFARPAVALIRDHAAVVGTEHRSGSAPEARLNVGKGEFVEGRELQNALWRRRWGYQHSGEVEFCEVGFTVEALSARLKVW